MRFALLEILTKISLENIFFCDRSFTILRTVINRKARSSHFGLKKELPQTAGSPKQYHLSNTFFGCLQDRRPAHFTFTSNSLWLVPFNFLSLPALLERTSLLQWSLPVAAKRKQRSEAQRRYRQTPKGKKAHCHAENRRRGRLRKKNHTNMDDATTTRLPAWCMGLLLAIGKRILPVQTTTCCHFCGSCGQIVDEFPRRGYG